MQSFRSLVIVGASATAALALSVSAQAAECPVTHDRLVQALKESVGAGGKPDNGGLPVNEWAAVVDRSGTVCAIAFSGDKPTDQWLGSRAIAIEKANTVNAFSLKSFAISTANLWAPSQPGGSLYGLGVSNPPLADALYAGDMSDYGTPQDPILGKHPGGIIVFGGGLALYGQQGLVGGLGASGNTSCADHNIAWRVRQKLGFDKVPDGPSPDHNDEIVYDVGQDSKSQSGWGHPQCGLNAPQIAKQIGSGIVVASSATEPANQQTGQAAPGKDLPPLNAKPAVKGASTLPDWQKPGDQSKTGSTGSK